MSKTIYRVLTLADCYRRGFNGVKCSTECTHLLIGEDLLEQNVLQSAHPC